MAIQRSAAWNCLITKHKRRQTWAKSKKHASKRKRKRKRCFGITLLPVWDFLMADCGLPTALPALQSRLLLFAPLKEHFNLGALQTLYTFIVFIRYVATIDLSILSWERYSMHGFRRAIQYTSMKQKWIVRTNKSADASLYCIKTAYLLQNIVDRNDVLLLNCQPRWMTEVSASFGSSVRRRS